METVLFSNLKQLYDCELYNSAIPVASLLQTVLQNERSVATPDIEYQVLMYAANALYYEHKYREACKRFEAALLMRKSLLSYMNNAQLLAIEANHAHFNEPEMRYRLAICYRDIGEHTLAVSTLQSMPIKQRSPKLNMLLAQLLHYGKAANITESIVVYKELLRQCPMAFTAIHALLALGIEGNEVNSLVMNASCISKNIEWLNSWIKGHALMFHCQHLEAARSFMSINDIPQLRQNTYILTEIGRSFYYYGNFARAQEFLEIAVMRCPNNMQAIMPLAAVYENNQRVPELEKLCSKFTNLSEFTSEHWFVIAQLFYATNRVEKASSFTHKALSLDARNVEAHLLRGKIALHLKRYKDAICFFRHAQCIAMYRFEVYKGLFQCYLGLQRLKEAQTICAMAMRYFRNSPRGYVMFARTLFNSTNPVVKKNARKFVNKAFEYDEYYAPAVCLMAELCQAEGEPQKAIEVLSKQVTKYPNHKIFTMLGDILSAEKDLNGALEYYTIALNMEPSYYRALEGVNALGHVSKSSNEESKEPDAEGDTPMANVSSCSTEQTSSTSIAVNERLSLSVNTPTDDWPIDCNEATPEVVVDIPAAVLVQDDPESDILTDPLWQDVDADLTN